MTATLPQKRHVVVASSTLVPEGSAEDLITSAEYDRMRGIQNDSYSHREENQLFSRFGSTTVAPNMQTINARPVDSFDRTSSQYYAAVE